MKHMDDRLAYHLFSDAAGSPFGTTDLCMFLHSLVRMNAPKNIVELGTGMATSAISMALAVKQNQVGKVWTVDNFELFNEEKGAAKDVLVKLRESGILSLEDPTAEEYYSTLACLFDVDACLTFIKSTIVLNQAGHFDHYPFSGTPIDLLFSDFRHCGIALLALLGHFLPRMAPASSIFIHSASTLWPSYLLLEQIVSQLNAGRVPKTLQDFCSADLSVFVRSRRIVLVHLTDWKFRKQNSAAWLKIEPVDILPYPISEMRGLNAQLMETKEKCVLV